VAVEGRVSVINKMLQDLDRRQALGAGADTTLVRASSAKAGGHEWFWRILVVLLAAALAWMGWVAIQLLPRKPLVTELAFQAAAEARSRAAAKPAPAPAAPVAVPQQVAPVEEPKPAAAPATTEPLRLAVQLETPVREAPPEPTKPEAAKPEAAKPAVAKKPAPAQAPAKGSVDKRDRARTASDNAEAHFRRAALLLGHGRVSEAEAELAAALRADAAHTAARQTYVSMLLEQGRVSAAQRLLQQALALNPEQPAFAIALARIHAGQRDYGTALEVLERAGAAGDGNADFQAMRGAVLRGVGRHGEAVEAYQNALRGSGAQPAATWIGLGISLESLGRRSEAVLAYRRALAAGPIAQEAREYAESRARALE